MDTIYDKINLTDNRDLIVKLGILTNEIYRMRQELQELKQRVSVLETR